MDYLGWIELFSIGCAPANRLDVGAGGSGPIVVVHLPAVKMKQDPTLRIKVQLLNKLKTRTQPDVT
jgi:hypothetical protein